MNYYEGVNVVEYVVGVIGQRDDVVEFREHFFTEWMPSHDYMLNGEEYERITEVDVPSRMTRMGAKTYQIEGPAVASLKNASELIFKFTAPVAVPNPLAGWTRSFPLLIFDGRYEQKRVTKFTVFNGCVETYSFSDDYDHDSVVPDSADQSLEAL
jgi:hypothetical protein